MARSVAVEYMAGNLGGFFRLGAGDLESAVAARRADIDRDALVGALRAYHADLGTLDSAVEAQLIKLAHPHSRVVVTGQQAGALTGPAYSVHKGADAALLARQLDREDAPVVAVYWVASQDHDAAEVASTVLLDLAEHLHHVTFDVPEGRPVGRVPWSADFTAQALRVLDAFDAPPEHVRAVRERILKATSAGGTYADVFARLIHGLLGHAGLLVLDPLHPALARLMAPALARELRDPLASSTRIENAAARLEAAGLTAQLRRPAGATNVFVEEDDGQRRLLRVDGRALRTETRTYTLDDLLALLDMDPSRVTPAAGLRPIVQDTLLPTLAFVVGPGEITYGAQLRDVYPLHGLEQPLLWPRLTVTWLEPNVARLLRRVHATAAQVQADPEGVLGAALAGERNASALTHAALDALNAQLDVIVAEIGTLDPTLVGAATKTQLKVNERVGRLQRSAVRALARQEDDRSGQLTRLRAHLLPDGIPQERHMNFLTFLLKHGTAPLDLLLALPAGFRGDLTIP